jgi:succinyl-CoA synthetase beta subunit
MEKERIELHLGHADSGWLTEPRAKDLLVEAGFEVPRFRVARNRDEAFSCAEEMGYPLVAKVVSPKIIHKSERGGVVLGIPSREELGIAFDRLSDLDAAEGVLVEETVAGVELIIGAKMDRQFGPVILLGIGGTGVEIYQDMCLRMAPLDREDCLCMLQGLRGRKLIEGYRGSEPVDRECLVQTVLRFSDLVMDLADRITSIDLNPVMCTGTRCVVADARIILSGQKDTPITP